MTGWDNASVRALERESIRNFVASHTFVGRTLDFGCGKQPYRDLVERTATYYGYDDPEFPASLADEHVGGDDPFEVEWDTILCTQVVQYVPDVWRLIRKFRQALRPGTLVLTFPTCWDEVEPDDIHRFTKNGMERLLLAAGFEIVRSERRAAITLGGFSFPLGGGVVGAGI